MDDLPLRPALELAELVQRRQISALELLDLHLARYEAHNPAVNAVVFTQIEQARSNARWSDNVLAAGRTLGPLHGVPMTIKDSYDWVGSPSTWGIPERVDNYPRGNATAVQRLLDAGAIIYGKTNVPHKLADWQSFNSIYGTTNNPWDLTRTPGGSSGGSAAALATGMASLEIGSDIGASIRNPAHYCGVFGHKPTMGIVPLRGHLLPDDHAHVDILVGGPLARGAGDLKILLEILAGPTGAEQKAWRLHLPPARKTDLGAFRVGMLMDSPVCAQDDELTEQLLATVDALERAGLQVDRNAAPQFDWARYQEVYFLLLRAASGTGFSDEEYLFHLQSSESRTPKDTRYRAYLDRGVTLRYRDWFALHNEREQMRKLWAKFFTKYDVLLSPIAASAAFVHNQDGERPDRTILVNGREELVVDQLFWAGLSSVVHLPSTVAPAGLTRSGLPCGMQIIADYLEDNTALEFARLMEEALGGFKVPPGYG